MTKFRYPDGWTTRREPGQRPELAGSWLDPDRSDKYAASHSYEYWTKIHWATPPWMTSAMFQEMRELYEDCNPRLHHADHIVPLTHSLVCGLNVPWNLQRLSCEDNMAKSNNHWPDCPDHLCPIKNETKFMWSYPDPHQMTLPI